MSHSTLKSFMNDGSGTPPPATLSTEPAPATERAAATEPAPAPEAAARRLTQLIFGKMVSRAIGVAAELGVADHLRRGPAGHEELARRVGANAAALYRLLRALASVGVFEEQSGRRFANNELSAALVSEAPGSMRNMARLFVGDLGWAAWGGLGHSVKSGAVGFDAVFGKDMLSWLSEHPESQQMFRRAMGELGDITARAVVEAYDFSAIETIVEVGGGKGELLSLILERHPLLRGVLFDTPEVIAATQLAREASGLAARTTAVGGDCFAGVPSGADAYIMQLITRDWADGPCVEVLRNCRRSMAAGGRVLIVDAVVGEGPESELQKLMDLEMLVLTVRRERTESELGALLGRAGLTLARVVPSSAPASIIEAFAA